MKRTLYEILEVSESASNEVIEKAYKVLAKKYHPDLQSAENKMAAESKMKEINDAYDVLGNEQKRKDYDAELNRIREEERLRDEQQRNSEESYTAPYQPYTSNNQTEYQNNVRNPYNKADDMQRRRYEENLKRQEQKMRQQMEENLQQEYQNAYYNYLRSLGYRIKEKWTWKRTKDLIIALAVMMCVFAVLWFFPPTHKMLINFYESNKLIKIIIDIIISIISAIFKAIGELFRSIFLGGN